jgi:hypothetical protein
MDVVYILIIYYNYFFQLQIIKSKKNYMFNTFDFISNYDNLINKNDH